MGTKTKANGKPKKGPAYANREIPAASPHKKGQTSKQAHGGR